VEDPVTSVARGRNNGRIPRRQRRAGRDDRLGLLIAFGAVAGVIALSAVAGAVASNRQPPTGPTAEQIAASLQNGSILILAPDGYPCRQKLIDNATWIIRDNGVVDCETAVSKITSTQRQKWSAERVEAIRSGLTGR
jgi:hypothetical protein